MEVGIAAAVTFAIQNPDLVSDIVDAITVESMVPAENPDCICNPRDFVSNDPETKVYHRRISSSQPAEDVPKIIASGELWGSSPRNSDIPKVQAHEGPLPDGVLGFEFTTFAVERPLVAPGWAEWVAGFPGVWTGVENINGRKSEVVKINISVTKFRLE